MEKIARLTVIRFWARIISLRAARNAQRTWPKDLRCATRTFCYEKMLGKVPSLIYEDLLPHPRAKADLSPTK